MADDLIHCPACGFQLRLPPELYGTAVECPQCHGRFTAPIPAVKPVAVRPPPGREYDAVSPVEYGEPAPSRAALTAPAICLLVSSCLAAFMFAGLSLSLVELRSDPAEFDRAMEQALNNNPKMRGPQREQAKEWMLWTRDNGPSVFGALFALNALTAIGAILMLTQRGYWIAVLGCVAALNPVNLPCCLLQLPFGIWGLIALMSESGRRAFR